MEKKTILTCVQATGQLHLGNYLGAVKHWINYLSDEFEPLFGIADMHSITVHPYIPADLRKNTLNCLALYLACGLNPDKCHLFIQSHITGHAELAWIFQCITPVGLLERMTQFKDKSQKPGISIGTGLLTYPTLMAADILLYNAHYVPVGEDQKQHLELTRDIAHKFNQTYSDTFILPEPVIPPVGARIMSLQEPTKKMSKSDSNPNATIFLLDSPDLILKKISSAVTDSSSEIKFNPQNKPGVSNLLEILSLILNQSIETLEIQFQSQSYQKLKQTTADALIQFLSPIQKKYHDLLNNKDHLFDILKKGNDYAQNKAYRMLSKVYRKVGFFEKIK